MNPSVSLLYNALEHVADLGVDLNPAIVLTRKGFEVTRNKEKKQNTRIRLDLFAEYPAAFSPARSSLGEISLEGTRRLTRGSIPRLDPLPRRCTGKIFRCTANLERAAGNVNYELLGKCFRNSFNGLAPGNAASGWTVVPFQENRSVP